MGLGFVFPDKVREGKAMPEKKGVTKLRAAIWTLETSNLSPNRLFVDLALWTESLFFFFNGLGCRRRHFCT